MIALFSDIAVDVIERWMYTSGMVVPCVCVFVCVLLLKMTIYDKLFSLTRDLHKTFTLARVVVGHCNEPNRYGKREIPARQQRLCYVNCCKTVCLVTK